jgi:hypothetical protein
MADLRAVLLAHLPTVPIGDTRHSIILPDGRVATFQMIDIRRSKEGGMTLGAYQPDGSDDVFFVLHVLSRASGGYDTISLPALPGHTGFPGGAINDAIGRLMEDKDLLRKVVGFFPSVQAEAFGAKGTRPSVNTA